MATKTIDHEIIATNVDTPISLQLDKEQDALYVLTNYQLTRIDLNSKEYQREFVYQHKTKVEENQMDDDDEEEEEEEYYSQGESDGDEDRVEDPFEDSEPSTGDDEDRVINRRNWRRYGYRIYQFDNPCSLLYLQDKNQFIVLNEGVIKFFTIQLENNRPFVQSPSKHIFCYDFDVLKENNRSIQPWSITKTSQEDYFLFSLLDSSQLYSLDMTNEKARIEKFITTEINSCPYLQFHRQSNQIFVYDSTQIFTVSINEKIPVKLQLPFDIEEGKGISSLTIGKSGFVYVLVNSNLYKCDYQQSKLSVIEDLGKLNLTMNSAQMIVDDEEKNFYASDCENSTVYRWKI
ncbi:unnamed protein product [Adineta ricciae]|uniref:Uncharacterized protein n=1 Tax=Adineta ricciae TaxID=249248 RepID=A0A815J7Q3_ADIRI|nr:unnamed protein product [Adineta ricciae]